MAARRRRKTQRLFLGVLVLAVCVGAVLVLPFKAPEKVAANKAADETAAPPIVLAQLPEITEAPLPEESVDITPEPAVLANQAPAVAASQNAPILYYGQSGDSLDVLALRFGVSVSDISST